MLVYWHVPERFQQCLEYCFIQYLVRCKDISLLVMQKTDTSLPEQHKYCFSICVDFEENYSLVEENEFPSSGYLLPNFPFS